MELRDLIVTPLLLFIICLLAIRIRPHVTDDVTRRYFFPALAAKIAGALALGFIYQFYYGGGDTFNFHTLGSRHAWEAFMDSPEAGLKIIFGGNDQVGIYKYTSKILFYHDPASFFVIRIASIFDLITFSAYSGTAVLFSVLSFAGAWALFYTFYKRYVHLHFYIAICILFIPSVLFWGSGVLKDTVVISALGFATYSIDILFIQRRWRWSILFLLLVSLFVILRVKLFILQAFLPASICWILYKQLISTPSMVMRVLIFPPMIVGAGLLGYWAVMKVGENDKRYSIENMAKTAKITAYDIGFYTGRDAGSGYSLGELDGTFINMVSKAPQAINVSLFRPYLWEVKNPLMLLSSLEGMVLLFLVGYVLLSVRSGIFTALKNQDVIFALLFSLIMAFAVGITSYNFGTLARYKIPLLPYFTLALVLIYYESRERKFD